MLPLFVIDPRLWGSAGAPRRAWLLRSLRSLDRSMGGQLVVRSGDPVRVVADIAAQLGAGSVHVTADAGPYGRVRDDGVERALGDTPLVRTGSPYVVTPGTLTTATGSPYQVFTPFYRAWLDLAGNPMQPGPPAFHLVSGIDSEPLLTEPVLAGVELPAVGEAAAAARWQAFEQDGLCHYRERRDRPDLSGTSEMSTHLKFGEIHPRTLLHTVTMHSCAGAEAVRRQLAWRDFYADVLWHRPSTVREYVRPSLARMEHNEPAEQFQQWCTGNTGYPFVDAGMRQLLATGWMHNRVRMVSASFLVKDLHVEWTHGARHFMRWLRDGDLASNQHGWQWVAGCGTDAAPYFRVFNPVLQGRKFDPAGDYVRRWIPELSHVPGALVHEPWTVTDGYDRGYQVRIVDHAQQRQEAIRRYQAARTSG